MMKVVALIQPADPRTTPARVSEVCFIPTQAHCAVLNGAVNGEKFVVLEDTIEICC